MKKILKTIATAIGIGFFLFAIVIIIVGTVARSKNKMMNIFGFSFSVVGSDSMEPTIMTGEFIIIRQIDFNKVKASKDQGDIIVFYSEKEQKYIVHRAIEKDDENITTKGDNPKAPIDDEPVTEENFYGVVAIYGKFLNIGNVILRYRNWVFALITVFLLYAIISETINIVKIAQAEKEVQLQLKKEQEYERLLEQEKEKIRNEILEEQNQENKDNSNNS